MKWVISCLAALVLLSGQACAASIPETLEEALPESAEVLLEEGDFSTGEGFLAGVRSLGGEAARQLEKTLERRLKGAASILAVVILCGAMEGFQRGAGGKDTALVTMAGALTIALLTAGDIGSLMGLGRKTIGDLSAFSRVLLPVLAAAAAAAGGMTTATVQQVSAVLLSDVLIRLISSLLMPMVYLYTAVLTASCALPESRLDALSAGLKKAVTWVLTTVLLCFTLYLSVTKVVTGAVDAAGVRVAKAAISGVVPVVGGIISEAAETVLAGAGILKNTIGIFGTLAVLAACIHPFIQLGVQYLLYKLAAFLASVLGAPRLYKLIDGLGGAFGLILGMTGSCAVLLLVSVLTSLAAVMP